MNYTKEKEVIAMQRYYEDSEQFIFYIQKRRHHEMQIRYRMPSVPRCRTDMQ